MKAAGKGTGSYFGFITNQGRKFIAKLPKMKARPAEIRKELAALPESRTYSYRLEPVK